MLSHDTDKAAAMKQMEVLRGLGISGRMGMTFELSDTMRSIVLAGIRHRHRKYNDREVMEAWFRLTLEPELFREAFPDSEVSP